MELKLIWIYVISDSAVVWKEWNLFSDVYCCEQ